MSISNHRPLDPRKCNIAVDANALDRDGTVRDRLVDRFNELSSGRRIRAVVARGVRSEIQHPRTPDHVKAALLQQIFNLRPGLNAPQEAARHRVQAILQGNAKPARHAADASHLSEAAETGCAYFITHDKRILNNHYDQRGRELFADDPCLRRASRSPEWRPLANNRLEKARQVLLALPIILRRYHWRQCNIVVATPTLVFTTIAD